MNLPSIVGVSAARCEDDYPATLDLAALAGIGQGDRVVVAGLRNRTLELFESTLGLVDDIDQQRAALRQGKYTPAFLPQEEDLRTRFKFAEVLGSYATLNSLLDRYAPAYTLTRAMDQIGTVAEISLPQIAQLEEYRCQIQAALEHAAEFLSEYSIAGFSNEELHELNDILGEARRRFHSLDTLLGMRLIHDVEQAVQRLHRLHEKTQTVQRTISGIFLVDSEIMFLPANELIRMVEDIFKAIGNPFVVQHIDGTLLLAARNLLIQVISFYSYYGREQIYQVFGAHQGKAGRAQVAHCIRDEIRLLFSACKVSNKLVLTRMMDSAEREFELSIEAIQAEAASRAIVAVERLMPIRAVIPPRKHRGIFQRLSHWLFRPAG